MKRIILTTALFCALGSQTVFAQGVLGKLKEKTSSGGIGGPEKDYTGWPLPNEAQGKKDMENTKLDATVFPTDKWGVNGIYISQKPLGSYHEFDKLDKTIQKYALTISEDGTKITLNHSAESKSFGPIQITPLQEGGSTGVANQALRSKGILFNMQITYETIDQTAVTFKDSTEYDGKTVSRGVSIQAGNFTMLEPGVFVFHPYARAKNGVTTCEGGSKLNGEEHELKYNPFNLVYKKGKDVSKWTDQAIIAELFRQSDMFCQIVINADAANTEMPKKVTGFKDEPKNADLLAAARARAKAFNWIETITAVYPIKEWSNIIEPKGNQGLPTLTKRSMMVIAMMKTPKGECAIETIEIMQDNAYTVGSQAENFVGKPVFANSNGMLTPIDCKKMK
ncbi:MAG: hypothetical protein ACO1N0_06120 [Fluviicola sp.]